MAMPDVVFRVLLPVYAACALAAILIHRVRVSERIGRDPVVIRPFAADTPLSYLESVLTLGIPALGLDVTLNAVWPRWVEPHLAIGLLRRSPVVGVVGLASVTVGLLVCAAAVRHMGASWRIGVDRLHPGPLVTGGLFRRIRHPIYAGMLSVTTGMALVTADVLSLVTAGAAWVGLPIQARLEEEFLVARYGDEYRRHQARTGRFWPRR
jgi:protein-S-isoprenylcysteine O-methyltransferase Ste14